MKPGVIPEGAVPFKWLEEGDYFFELTPEGKPNEEKQWRVCGKDYQLTGQRNAYAEHDHGQDRHWFEEWELVVFNY